MRQQKTLAMVVTFATALSLISCSTHKARLTYSDFKEMPVKEGNASGKSLGEVSGEEGGAIWDNCTEKARGSVLDLIDSAKKKGATAVGNIKWHATGTAEAGCRKGWGYLIIWPFILTPLFMSTRVDGTAYKSGGGSAGIHKLPTTPEEEDEFVKMMLAGL